MKKANLIYPLTAAIAVLFLTTDCKKEEPATLPELYTKPVTNITTTSVISGGIITTDGRAAITANGVCWSAEEDPTISDSKTIDAVGSDQFVSNLNGLTEGTTYYLRAYATNSVGTAYGEDIAFSTLGQSPSVLTQPASGITLTEAILNGTVNANLLSTTVTFEYGTTSSYGQTITATQSPVTGNTMTNVSAQISGLTTGTKYHFRVVATNSVGTTNGNDVTFAYTVSDIEGNVYSTVKIGTQLWMAENLKTTKYRNGDLIGTTTPATKDISSESTPKYQWSYNGTESNVPTYGRLYTWYTITDSRNVCPLGWHIPSDAELTTLSTFLGGETISGGKLKETGTSHWREPNTGATNVSGFTALPGGYRNSNGTFSDFSSSGVWWSSSEFSTNNAYYRYIFFDFSNFYRNYYNNERDGYSVRCVKDN